jgi:hypothetical protein
MCSRIASNRVVAGPLIAAILSLQGCTSWIVDWESSWPSPDGQRKLIVTTVGIKPHLRIVLQNGTSKQTAFADDGEWYVSFLQTYWSPDSKTCGLYIAYDRSLLIAFDAQSGEPVDPTAVTGGLRNAVVEKYKLRERTESDPTFDPLNWVRTQEAESAYRILTYGQ